MREDPQAWLLACSAMSELLGYGFVVQRVAVGEREPNGYQPVFAVCGPANW